MLQKVRNNEMVEEGWATVTRTDWFMDCTKKTGIDNPMAGSLWSWSKKASGLVVQSYALSN